MTMLARANRLMRGILRNCILTIVVLVYKKR